MIYRPGHILTFIFFVILLLTLTIGGYVHRQEQQRILYLAEQRALAQLEELRAEKLKLHAEQIRCMALNIYHEAGSEPFMGQVAVARVVMNRVRHGFASNPCKVIYQAHYVPVEPDSEEKRKMCQFSWVCEGKGHPHRNNPRYKQAEDIARQVILEDRWRDEIPAGALFFHNTSVSPSWAYQRIMTIGNHVFYGRGSKKKRNESQESS